MAPYAAPWWLRSAHAQTLYAALAAPQPRAVYRRTRWETPDGDFVDIDWLDADSPRTGAQAAPAPDRLPLLALFHGLEGSSASHYAHTLMCEARERGWRGAVVHFRGCSGEPNRLARAYHSGDSTELDWILNRLRTHDSAPLYAVGISLGGNVLLKWLGEAGASAGATVARAAAVSAPIDLTAAGEALGRGFNLIYTRAFLRTLKRKSLAKLEIHPDLYDAARVSAARTLRQFDDVVTAPLHGFLDASDYWQRASSKPWLCTIRVPTLLVNARDDPFLPEAALPQAREVSDALTCEFPAHGGHVGFVSGPFPGNLRWLPRRILEFFEGSD